jgi:hypothetical protein
MEVANSLTPQTARHIVGGNKQGNSSSPRSEELLQIPEENKNEARSSVLSLADHFT